MTENHRPPLEDRLRAALSERAATIHPSTDGLHRIEEKLMSDASPRTDRKPWLIGLASAAAATVLVLVAVTVLDGGEDDDVTAATTTSTTTDTTSTTASTTTEPSTTTTTAFTPLVDPYAVAFPSPDTARRFESPETVARAYATEVLGFTDLQLGELRQGDDRSGEMPLTDGRGGPETLVLVRQMEDGSWFVLGSTTENITVDQPEAGATVTAPMQTSGRALAFEGTVIVQVLTQDDHELLGEGTVTGSGVPPAGPFEGEIDFEPPSDERPGVVVYLVRSAEDGHVTEAASLPVRLSP